METYENLSFLYKVMLKRTKIMMVRLKDLKKIMNKNESELFIKNEQYSELQLECDGISASIGYLNIEIKRTIIMLKTCLYKQRIKKNISINEITTINSVNENNDLVETNRNKRTSTLICEYRDSEKQTNLEERRIQISSLQCSTLSKIMVTSTVNSINNTTIETAITNQESYILDGNTTYHGRGTMYNLLDCIVHKNE